METSSSFGLDAMLGWLAEGPVSPADARDELFADVDLEDVVSRALAEATKPGKRRRNLPDDVVLWIIVGMSIFRQHSLVQRRRSWACSAMGASALRRRRSPRRVLAWAPAL